jgi:hypothetical protein
LLISRFYLLISRNYLVITRYYLLTSRRLYMWLCAGSILMMSISFFEFIN